MFKNTLSELYKLQRFQYKMNVPVDEEGYIDKECPNKDCQFQFKIKQEDWKNLCRDEAIYCPKCGRTATSDKWFTTEQVIQAKSNAKTHIQNRILNALNQDAKTFNSTQRNGFIQLTMRVSGHNRQIELPLKCKEILVQKIQCEECGTRYSVIGSAFYCPCCGYNSSILAFDEFIKTTYAKLNNIQTIRKIISDSDDAERIIRSLLETIPNELVEAIECLSESIYNKIPNKEKTKKNVFQRIDESSKLWKNAIGSSFDDWLTDAELNKMKIYYQQRHLLIHKNGIVDEEYLKKTKDTKYNCGERIVFKEVNAREFTDIIKKLGNKIKEIKYNI